MSDDRELDLWQAEWSAGTPRVPDLSGWIRRARRRFFWQNAVAAAGLLFVVAFYAWYAWSKPELDRLVLAVGAAALVVFSVVYTVRNSRGTWRAASDTTRAFLELSERRALARLRANRIGGVLVWVWLLVIVPPALTWRLLHVHVSASFLLGLACGSLPLIALGFWHLRRQRLATLRELDEVRKLLREGT